jgi:uroporphyrinogen-III synthase
VRDANVLGPVESWEQLAAQAAEQLRELPSPGPLDGVRVVVTRDEPTDGPLASALRGLGAIVLHLPLTTTLPPSISDALHDAAIHLNRYEWLLITSQRVLTHAPFLFGDFIPSNPVTALLSPLPKVACVGNQTAAALQRRGVQPSVTVDEGTAQQLPDLIASGRDLAGKRILYPASSLADPTLPESLRAKGAAVDVVEAYRTEVLPDRQQMLAKLVARHQVDAILIASPSAARSLDGALRTLGRGFDLQPLIGSLGPTTSAELSRLGWPTNFESPQRSFQSLAEALAQAWTTRNAP